MNCKKLIAFSLFVMLLIVCMGTASAEGNVTKTFDDVGELIKDADTEVYLDGCYVGCGSVIKVSKNLNFTGVNNAVLDGNKSSSIISSSKDLSFRDVTFMNAKGTNDACVFSKGSLTFINCTFINNYAKNNPVVVGDKLSFVNCTFRDNNAWGIAYTGKTLAVEDSVFENNKAEYLIYAFEEGEAKNTRFLNNPEATAVLASFEFTISGCEFVSNRNGISEDNYGGEIRIRNSRFSNNTNAIYVDTFYIDIDIDNSSFSGSKSYGIYTLGNTKVSNSNFTANRVAFKSQTPLEEAYDIPVANKAAFSNCIFKSNTAGAIVTDNSLTVENSIFEANHGAMAGAILSENTYKGNTIKITGSAFINNSADYAGAIKAAGCKMTVKSSTFVNNTDVSIIVTSTSAYTMEGENYKNNAKLTVDSKTFTKSANLDNRLNQVYFVKVTAKKLTTSYKSGTRLSIKLINGFTSKPVKNSLLTLRVYTGSKAKNYEIRTNKNGIATFAASTLSAGTHKIEITSDYGVCKISKATTSVKITKAKTIVTAPKVTTKYKRTRYFKVSLKNKATKKAASYVVLKLKIGKKTYKVKTARNGIAKFNTRRLAHGFYRVAISSANSNYAVSARSSIRIVW